MAWLDNIHFKHFANEFIYGNFYFLEMMKEYRRSADQAPSMPDPLIWNFSVLT